MKFNKYLAISLGNYESKLLLASVDDNLNIRVLHTEIFVSKDCISDSIIIDKDKLKSLLEEKIKKIQNMFDYKIEGVIVNLPIKDLYTFSQKSSEYHLDKPINKKQWKKIYDNLEYEKNSHDRYLIDKKVNSWFIDGQEIYKPPFNMSCSKFFFQTQFYFAKKEFIAPYLSILRNIAISKPKIVCDALIFPLAFKNNLRKNKLLVNISHNSTEIILYRNNALIYRRKNEFGIKHLTKQISEELSILEEESIQLLKDYNDCLLLEEKSIPFAIIQNSDFKSFTSFDIEKTNLIFTKWLMKIIEIINEAFSLITPKGHEVDEIYISSSIDFFDKWINFITAKLNIKVEIHNINSNIIGINENKFNTLYYSIKYLCESSN